MQERGLEGPNGQLTPHHLPTVGRHGTTLYLSVGASCIAWRNLHWQGLSPSSQPPLSEQAGALVKGTVGMLVPPPSSHTPPVASQHGHHLPLLLRRLHCRRPYPPLYLPRRSMRCGSYLTIHLRWQRPLPTSPQHPCLYRPTCTGCATSGCSGRVGGRSATHTTTRRRCVARLPRNDLRTNQHTTSSLLVQS